VLPFQGCCGESASRYITAARGNESSQPRSIPHDQRYSQIYYRDIYDHLVRFHDLVESLRDIVTGTMDIYLNSTSLRLNEVMKALTIVSTIFLPLSFVAGVYGMNFDFMPELHWQYGYLLVWLLFIFIVTGSWPFLSGRGGFSSTGRGRMQYTRSRYSLVDICPYLGPGSLKGSSLIRMGCDAPQMQVHLDT
jgi:hypothetical protein